MIDASKYRRELFIRLPRQEDEAIERLTAIYETRTAVVLTAIRELDAKHRNDTGGKTSKQDTPPETVKPVTGRRRGGVAAYGKRYERDVGDFVDEPEEQDVLREMIALYEQGHGQSETARILNERGTLARKGKPWTKGNIDTILKTQGKK